MEAVDVAMRLFCFITSSEASDIDAAAMDEEDLVMAYMPRKRYRALTRTSSNDSPRLLPRSSEMRNLLQTTASSLSLPQPAFEQCGKPGLLVGSACSGWSCESQALTNLQVPHTISFLCDNDCHVEKWLRHNVIFDRFHKDAFHEDFIQEKSVDVFAAGPPCQPFSPEGALGGDDDERSQVIQPIKTYIARAQPRSFVLENVPRWGKSQAFKKTIQELQELEDEDGNAVYNVYQKILNTFDYGVAQHRSRLYCVGLLAKDDKGFSFPKPFQTEPDFKDILDSRALPPPIKDLSDLNPEVLKNETRRSNVAVTLNYFKKQGECPWTSNVIVDTQTGRGEKRFTLGHFPTLTASRCQGRAYFNLRMNRYHTMSELFRAQGSKPEGMDLTCISEAQLGHLCGNAMSVNVMTHLLGSIMLSW